MNARMIPAVDGRPDATQDEFADLKRIAKFFALVIGGGLAATIIYAAGKAGWDSWSAVLWALALLASGAGAGFLFGIPKVLQGKAAAAPLAAVPPAGGAPAAPAAPALAQQPLDYRQLVNTNLEEISDWLTKIIVGVSLIQLKSVPDHLWKLAGVISGSMGTTVNEGFGVALVLFYGTSGFLFGYLVTRLYIQGALARADRGVMQEGVLGERELVSRLSQANRDVDAALETAGAAAGTEPAAAAGANGAIDDELRGLADQYLRVGVDDPAARIRVKNDLAAKMAAHIIRRGISRDHLAEETHEGLLVALAAAVHYEPEPQDTKRLIAAAANANRLHVQYRFVMSFGCLVDEGFVTGPEAREIERILGMFEKRADAHLHLAIAGLRQKLQRQTGGAA